MKIQAIIYWTLIQLLFLGSLYGQVPGAVRITNVSAGVSEDSLRLRFTLTAERLNVGNMESLTLSPRLAGEKTTMLLPEVVYSGKLRKKYDDRKYTLACKQRLVYRVYSGISPDRTYRLEYATSVPYSPRLQPQQLVVAYHFNDCCSDYPVKEESYAIRAVWPQPEPVAETPPAVIHEPEPKLIVIHDTIYIRQEVERQPVAAPDPIPAPPAPKMKKESLYVEYPVNKYHVLPCYRQNARELLKLDRFLKGYVGIIRVTAYASPEGPYDSNAVLAENRAKYFREYLSKHYKIPASDISTQHVAEDWDGLRRQIEESHFAGKAEALRIIDETDILAGRESKLMELRGGAFWIQLKPGFRQLRRIEVEKIGRAHV
jgi:outer membrane protein OmpA-like peptidoglycan-associated protein